MRCSMMRNSFPWLILTYRGFDKGEYQNLFIDHVQVQELIADPKLRAVKFVGSTEGGKKVAELCGKYMKKGAFELGGSDAFIVLDDADIDLATTKAIAGRLHTNGQACNNSKRFIINDKIYDQFVEQLLKKLNAYVKMGDPMVDGVTIGPLSLEKQVHNLRAQVKQSVAKGAKIIYGDLEYQMKDEELKNGFYFHPIVLENINKDQPAYCEELFGPVFSLFRFSEDIEAVDLANGISYGLSASVFSRDIERA